MRFPQLKKLPPHVQYGEMPKETGEGQGQFYLKSHLPKRQETGFEYDNKAEYAVMNMQIAQGESKENLKLKLKILQGYAFRVCRREQMKHKAYQAGQHRLDRRQDQISQMMDTVEEYGRKE